MDVDARNKSGHDGGGFGSTISEHALVRDFHAREVTNDCVDVLGIDRRFVGGTHLVDLGAPLRLRPRRLIEHHAGGVAGQAIVVGRIRAGSLKHAVAIGQIDVHGFQQQFVLRPRAKRRQRPDRDDDGGRQRFARHLLPPHATVMGVCSMTSRMNPLGFQLAVSGCVSPLLLVHRTISTCDPLLGTTKRSCHWRKLYLPSSWPSWACCQDLPPSLEKSTRDTPVSPPNAMPRARVGAPAGTVSPALMLVMKERGTMRLIGTDLKPVSPGLTLACGVSGIVYAVAVQKFVSGRSST